ncbi:hypothetical protein LCGC14_2271650, partial [marine sediment metagenome]
PTKVLGAPLARAPRRDPPRVALGFVFFVALGFLAMSCLPSILPAPETAGYSLSSSSDSATL